MIHVITGHICAGKSTHVRQHAKAGDVIVDMDRLALAICPEDTTHHEYPQHIREIARRARRAIVDDAIRRHRQGSFDVWIIHTYPTTQEVTYYLTMRAGVKEVRCDTATLIERAKSERPREMQNVLASRLASSEHADILHDF